jgi:CHASE2 domain-containing sensor protein
MTGTAASPTKNLVQGVVIFLISLFFSLAIGESIFGKLLAQWTLDRFIRSDTRTIEDQIVLIDITEEDYNQIFSRRRPLDPATIIELVHAAYVAGAKLIAVDISTADWPEESEKLISRVPPKAAVVWARSFYLDHQSQKPNRRLERLLGDVGTSTSECYGVPALGQEAGIVRYFYSGLKIGIWQPSFINQIVHRSEHGSCLPPSDRDEERRIINFSAQIRTESASTLLAQSRQKDWGRRPEYEDKILILGGSFHSGSDTSVTPVGAMSGLEIVGQALSSAMRRNARKELGKGYSVLIDAGIGVVLFVVGLCGRRAQLVVTVTFVLLLGYFSLYVFRQYYLFVSFIPFVLGVLAHMCLGWLYELP